MHRRLSLLIGLLLLSGCGAPQHDGSPVAGLPASLQRPDGLALRATAGAWPDGVEPEAGLVAFRVEISNGTAGTIDLRRDDFELVTPAGATVRPVRPMQLFGSAEGAPGPDPVAIADGPLPADGPTMDGTVTTAGHRRVVRRSVTPVWRSPSYPRWAAPYPSAYGPTPYYGYRSGYGYGYGYTPWVGPRVYVAPYGGGSAARPTGRRDGSLRTGEGPTASGLAATTEPLFASVLRDTMLRPQSVVVATLYFATDADRSGTYRLRWLPRHAMSAEAETTLELTFASAE